jgi:protein-S-isoprenylcysteine O-methyltransferase Ste14
MTEFSRLILFCFVVGTPVFLGLFELLSYLRTRGHLWGKFVHGGYTPFRRMMSILGLVGFFLIYFTAVVTLVWPAINDNIGGFSLGKATVYGWLAVGLMGLGFIFIAGAMLQLGSAARFFLPEDRTRLVTGGFYAFCRNPVYLGLNLLVAGVFFLIPSLLYVFAYALVIIGNHQRILAEEDYLRERFGAEYAVYHRRVGRYLPRLRR